MPESRSGAQVSSSRVGKAVGCAPGFFFANCNCNYLNLAAKFCVYTFFFILVFDFCLRAAPFVICALGFNQQFCFVMALNQ